MWSRPNSRGRSSFPSAVLSADLLKLRQRFGRAFPGRMQWAHRLSSVPVAFRHLLCLHLELDRDDTLPRRYRGLIEADGSGPSAAEADAVDRLVGAYGAFLRGGQVKQAAGLLPQLEQFFTEPQIVEMTLLASLARGFAVFNAVLQLGEGDPRPA